jgi:hypothetical protein
MDTSPQNVAKLLHVCANWKNLERWQQQRLMRLAEVLLLEGELDRHQRSKLALESSNLSERTGR